MYLQREWRLSAHHALHIVGAVSSRSPVWSCWPPLVPIDNNTDSNTDSNTESNTDSNTDSNRDRKSTKWRIFQ